MTENTYIALLRGINVSGHKIILMADLKRAFENMRFSKVTTFIQSGNVVFKSENPTAKDLETKIEKAIKDNFTFDVKVIVKEYRDLALILEKNPFQETDIKSSERVYFTLLSQAPAKEHVETLLVKENDADKFSIIDKTVYILCKTGYNKTLFNNNFIEKTLKVSATSRNIDTIKKLLEIGKDL